GGLVEVKVRVEPDLWPVYADPAQVGQVLMNLVLNARDAMPRGGRVTVEVGNVTLEENQVRLGEGAEKAESAEGPPPREFLRLRVRDTGEGIPPEVQAKVFEPFFTTKEHGKGTGLGLAVVHGLVRQHGGWVECSSKVGEGSTFDVYLPRSRPP